MLGLPFLRQLNAVSDNAAHDNIDALIAQAELSNMKPMVNGGNVTQGYAGGGMIEDEMQGYQNGGLAGYREGGVVKDDDPLQIDMRMADPSIYNRSVISGKFGDERGIPDAWMQPATEPMPTPEQEAKFLEELNKIKIQQLIEKLKEEQIFNPTEIGGNMDGTFLKQAIIKEKTNSSGEKWSNFLQTLPYIENNQSLQFPPSILNRPPLPK